MNITKQIEAVKKAHAKLAAAARSLRKEANRLQRQIDRLEFRTRPLAPAEAKLVSQLERQVDRIDGALYNLRGPSSGW